MDLGVVILAYGPEPAYAQLLDALLAGGVAPGAVTLVHNPSRPGETLPGRPPAGVDVVQLDANLGYAGGMNAGLRRRLAAGSDPVLVLTHDLRFAADGLERLVEAATANPGYAILGPALEWRGRPFAFGGSLDRAGRARLRSEVPGGSAGVVAADWVEGSAILVRASALDRLGLFDERLFMYFEEVDLCLRAARAGLRAGVVLDARAGQEPGFERRPATYAYLMTRNGLELARRAAGARGLLVGVARASAESFEHLRVWLGRRSGAEQRRRGRARLLGTALGVAACAARRFGPPPAFLAAADAPRAR